jgi:hypothetical protein
MPARLDIKSEVKGCVVLGMSTLVARAVGGASVDAGALGFPGASPQTLQKPSWTMPVQPWWAQA